MCCTIVIDTEFLYVSLPGKILGIVPETYIWNVLHAMTQLASPKTCVLHNCYVYWISVCFSSREILGIEPETIARYDLVSVSNYMCITPWLYMNFCMFQFKVQFWYVASCCQQFGMFHWLCSILSKHNLLHMKENLAFITQQPETIPYYDLVDVCNYMCITIWLCIHDFCMF